MALNLYVVVEKGDEGNAESGPQAWMWEEDVLATLAVDGELEGAFGPPEDRQPTDRVFLDQSDAALRACNLSQENPDEQYVVFVVTIKPTGMWVKDRGTTRSRGMAEAFDRGLRNAMKGN